ncbi:MAG: ATP synthase F0 subunit B, partial [Anaerotignum sp.]|nr:ATP synthase F0 subunit B [Anaerotignum sp.]
DVLYGELNAENELLFPYEEGMTKADMLMNIADGMESLQPVMKNKYGYTAEEMAEDVVYDLFDRMGDLTYRTSSLESDLKSNEKYTQLKAEYEKRIAKVRREAEQQREKYESDAEARYARLKDRHKEQRINREMKKARETVERESKRLLTWLTGGTDKNHVPENMRVAVEKILTSITTKDARINQLQLIALKDVYGEHGPEGESGDYLEYDPDVTAILKEFTKQDKYKDGIIVLDDLSLEEMQDLSKMIRSLKHTIQKANKWMGLQRDLNVAEICDNQAFEWDNVKDATTYGAVRQLHKYFGMSMADANVFFKEFGKVAYETVWRGLRTAFDKKINFLAEAEEFSKEIDQKQVAKWRAMPPQKFELPSGDIWLTPTQVMSLYCLAKREDAKRHLYGGGMKAAAFKFMWKLGAKFPKEAMKQYAGRRVTEADINAITATLTDEQRATADKIQKFMVEHCAKWGNATSMLMFGYMKFGDPNYFPIRVDGDTLTSSVGDPQLRIKSIQNTGAAMPIDERAKNALVLEDIFSVLASHVEEMSSYAAFVPALSDLNKFVNYKVRDENGEIIFSMKTAIGQKVGPDAMGYIYDLLETLNGSPRAAKEGILPKTLVRNAKTASVAANLRVIAQQPTAYLRAGIVLDVKYLLQGMTPGKVDKEEVFKYCPIARWKDMGNYDMNIGKTVEQLVTGQTMYQKIIDKSMAGAGWADSVTWGWIWKACKAETADKYPELKGEEFLIKAGERMSEVIDDTQVVDSPLHRSQMMRNKSLYMQMITSYMSEPTKAVGLVASTVIECRKNPTKENKKKVMRTWRYLIATGVLTAAFAGAVDMFRDDDEDEELWEKFLQAFWGDQINAETPKDRAVALLGSNIGDNLNPLNSLPLMRDILSMLQGYEITRTDFAWMADIMNNIGKWNKYLSGESEYTLTALLGNTAQSLSKVTGMPVKSASRELDSVRRAVVGHMSGDIQYQNAKITYSISAEKNISRYVAMMLEARMNGDKALATKIYNEMVKAGIDNEKIENKIDSVSKKALESEAEVADGAEAYKEGDYDALIGAIDSLNKKGYSEKNATSAITKAYNKKYGDDEEEELTY